MAAGRDRIVNPPLNVMAPTLKLNQQHAAYDGESQAKSKAPLQHP